MSWINRTYFESIPFNCALQFVGHGTSGAAAFAYERLLVTLHGARIQYERIEHAARERQRQMAFAHEPSMDAPFPDIWQWVTFASETFTPLLVEIHFYLVAWAQCGHQISVLVHPNFPGARTIYNRHRKHFDHYTSGRNAFEHFHERLPGQKEEAKVKESFPLGAINPSKDFGSWDGQSYSFGGQSWDVTRASLTLLENIVEEVLAEVRSAVDVRIKEILDAHDEHGRER